MTDRSYLLWACVWRCTHTFTSCLYWCFPGITFKTLGIRLNLHHFQKIIIPGMIKWLSSFLLEQACFFLRNLLKSYKTVTIQTCYILYTAFHLSEDIKKNCEFLSHRKGLNVRVWTAVDIKRNWNKLRMLGR